MENTHTHFYSHKTGERRLIGITSGHNPDFGKIDKIDVKTEKPAEAKTDVKKPNEVPKAIADKKADAAQGLKGADKKLNKGESFLGKLKSGINSAVDKGAAMVNKIAKPIGGAFGRNKGEKIADEAAGKITGAKQAPDILRKPAGDMGAKAGEQAVEKGVNSVAQDIKEFVDNPMDALKKIPFIPVDKNGEIVKGEKPGAAQASVPTENSDAPKPKYNDSERMADGLNKSYDEMKAGEKTEGAPEEEKKPTTNAEKLVGDFQKVGEDLGKSQEKYNNAQKVLDDKNSTPEQIEKAKADQKEAQKEAGVAMAKALAIALEFVQKLFKGGLLDDPNKKPEDAKGNPEKGADGGARANNPTDLVRGVIQDGGARNVDQIANTLSKQRDQVNQKYENNKKTIEDLKTQDLTLEGKETDLRKNKTDLQTKISAEKDPKQKDSLQKQLDATDKALEETVKQRATIKERLDNLKTEQLDLLDQAHDLTSAIIDVVAPMQKISNQVQQMSGGKEAPQFTNNGTININIGNNFFGDILKSLGIIPDQKGNAEIKDKGPEQKFRRAAEEPVGAKRMDKEGNTWEKQKDGFWQTTKTDANDSGFKGTSWSDSLMDQQTASVVEQKADKKAPEAPKKEEPKAPEAPKAEKPKAAEAPKNTPPKGPLPTPDQAYKDNIAKDLSGLDKALKDANFDTGPNAKPKVEMGPQPAKPAEEIKLPPIPDELKAKTPEAKPAERDVMSPREAADKRQADKKAAMSQAEVADMFNPDKKASLNDLPEAKSDTATAKTPEKKSEAPDTTKKTEAPENKSSVEELKNQSRDARDAAAKIEEGINKKEIDPASPEGRQQIESAIQRMEGVKKDVEGNPQVEKTVATNLEQSIKNLKSYLPATPEKKESTAEKLSADQVLSMLQRNVDTIKQTLEFGHGPDDPKIAQALNEINQLLSSGEKIKNEDAQKVFDALKAFSKENIHVEDKNNGTAYEISMDTNLDSGLGYLGIMEGKPELPPTIEVDPPQTAEKPGNETRAGAPEETDLPDRTERMS